VCQPTAGVSGEWPLPIFNYYFSRKFIIAFRRSQFKPWPSRMQPLVGPPLVRAFDYKLYNINATKILIQFPLPLVIIFYVLPIEGITLLPSNTKPLGCTIFKIHKKHNYKECISGFLLPTNKFERQIGIFTVRPNAQGSAVWPSAQD